jgi:AraC-like DNA-binding protein
MCHTPGVPSREATLVTRPPRPELRPLVHTLWASMPSKRPTPAAGLRERVLPTGAMHLVVRLSAPLRVIEPVTGEPTTLGHAIVGGARAEPYIRETSAAEASVGAMLRPGAALALFGVPATILAQHHTSLEELWGDEVAEIHARLLSSSDAQTCLARFEALLSSRVLGSSGPPPVVAHALERLAHGAGVREVVEETGFSHRHFLTLFGEAVGLTPKLYAGVQRFQAAVHMLAKQRDRDLAQVALAVGYADQSHMTRAFRAHAGLTPGAYRRLALLHTHHVPDFNFVQDRRRRS